MITKFKLFLEAKLGNLAKIIGNNKDIDDILSKDFDDDKLIDNVILPKYNKTIHINWNDSNKHNIKKKIKNRSDFLTISEFNDVLKNVLLDLFNDFDLLEPDIEQYDLFLTETKIHIITIIKYEQLFNDNSNIFIITILPQLPKKVDKIIEFNY